MAMMASANSRSPYDEDNQPLDDDDFIDPDDPNLNLDDPLEPQHSDRERLTGNISSGRPPVSPGYLTNQVPGEDRRAPTNTIDETVWETLSRDLVGIWQKMQLVLWPKHLLGGLLQRTEGGELGAAERGEGEREGLSGRIRGITGRWPVDADAVLQGSMSEGLRNWDLWGPLLFCLLLSLFLSMNAGENQKDRVFSGVFAIVWIGAAVVTMQIKLLGGVISFFQSVCVIGYTLLPLVIASFLSIFHIKYAFRIPLYIMLVLWSLAAGISILGGSGVIKNRVGLAVYPLLVFYISLGCLCFIS